MGKRELVLTVTIHDCEVQTFRSGGPGGQNQNKRNTGVRIIHHPSGARAECREERTQLQNKKRAFKRLSETPEFRYWAHVQSGKVKDAEIWVQEQITDEKIRVERRNKDGKWEDWSLDE